MKISLKINTYICFLFFSIVINAQIETNKVLEIPNFVYYLEQSFDSKYILFAEDSVINVIDISTQKKVNQIPYYRPGTTFSNFAGKSHFITSKKKHHIAYFEKKNVNTYMLVYRNYITNEIVFEHPMEPLSVVWGREPYGFDSAPIDSSLVVYFQNKSFIINVESKQIVFFEETKESINGISLSPDRERVAIGTDKSLIIYNCDDKKVCDKLNWDDEVTALKFINNDSIAVAVGGKIYIQQLSSKRNLKIFSTGVSEVSNIYCNNNVFTYSGIKALSRNTIIHVWKISNLHIVGEFVIREGRSVINLGINTPKLLSYSSKQLSTYELVKDKLPRIVSQNGHTNQIGGINYSYDKRYMITYEAYNSECIIIWDVKLNKVLKRYKGNIKNACFCPYSYDIITYDGINYNFIYWDIVNNYSNDLTNKLTFNNDDAEKKYEEISNDIERYAKIKERIFREYKVEASLIDCNNKNAAFYYYDNSLYKGKLVVYNIKTNVFEEIVLDNNIGGYGDKPIKFFNSSTVAIPGSKYSIVLYNWKTNEVIQEFTGDDNRIEGQYIAGIHKLILSNKGDTLISSHDGARTIIWDLVAAEKSKQINREQAAIGKQSLLSYQNNLLALETYSKDNYQSLFNIYNLYTDSLNIIVYLDTLFNINKGYLSLNSIGKKGIINSAILSNDNSYALIQASYAPIQASDVDNWIDLIDLESGNVIKTYGLNKEFKNPNMSVSPNFKYICIWEDGCDIVVIDIKKGKKVKLVPEKFKIDRINNTDLQFSKLNDNMLIIKDDYDQLLKFIDFTTKKIVKTIDRKQERSILKADYNKEYGGIYSPIVIDEKNGSVYHNGIHPTDFKRNCNIICTSIENNKSEFSIHANDAEVQNIAIARDEPYMAAGLYNNSIILFDTESQEQLVKIINTTGKSVFLTPEYYYKADKTSLKEAYFRFNNKLFPFEQFDLRLNRPDIVLERIGLADTTVVEAYKKAYLKRLSKMGISEKSFSSNWHTPEIEITNYGEIPIKTSEKIVNIKIEANDSIEKLRSINVWVNDVAIYGLRGVNISQINTGSISKELEIQLSSGKNKIQISCLNEKGAESYKEAMIITYEPKEQKKPNLYFIALSTSEYQQSQFNLKYAVKDGRDLANQFSLSTNEYENIYVDTLFNEDATIENTIKLKEKLLQSDVDDQVVLFVSGHGLLDDNYDFYFASHDIDFNNPAERGISYDKLEWLLDSIPARKKLFMMDACHSGEVDKEELTASNGTKKEEGIKSGVKSYSYRASVFQSGDDEKQGQIGLQNSFELMQELFTNLNRGSGAVVISAAAGDSYALESDVWNNGVFTYSVLNGLKNKEADTNKDGEVTVSELREYVINNVQDLTNGKQKPTTRQENVEYDFRVW
ncbi:caspase family protein [Labilibacter marinus]|uniref:caspase family protein n=1 Tax=Labilibacter marinus TaxID=1477105 RepID=UPI0009502815|nr:caspase family protein [Labilibacter marinus]